MAELTEQALNEAADVVEAVADEVANGLRMVSARSALVSGVLMGVAGAAAGYFFAEKKLRTKYETLAEEEIEVMRDHFRARLIAREATKPPVEDLGTKVKELGYDTPAQPWPKSDPPIPDVPEDTDDHEVDTVNVFEQHPAWDQAAEVEARNWETPYVIHQDERHEVDHDEITLTYYDGDDVLCNDNNEIITDQDKIIGLGSLLRFGHGSNDPNIVYVRNPVMAIDLEVIKVDGTYAEYVHGMKHSEEPRRSRIRWDE